MSILFVELCDVVLQSTLYFIVLHIWFHFFSSENGVGLEIFSFYLIGSIQYFLISYFLSYFFKSPMGSLAILLLFPILLQPFIERVAEPMTSYLFYNIITDYNTRESILLATMCLCYGIGVFTWSHSLPFDKKSRS